MRRWLRTALSVASLVLALVLVVLGVPFVANVSWSEVAGRIGALPVAGTAGLLLLWLAGLWVYTYVLTASLDGLGHAQAFTLNAVGSAVSNVLPFGGAAGVAVTFLMARRWGLRPAAIAASALVTGIWNTMGKLALPGLGLGLLAVSGHLPDQGLTSAALGASALLLAGLAGVVAVLRHEPVAVRTGVVVDAAARALPEAWRPTPGRVGGALVGLRRSTIELVALRWREMSGAMIAYLALQAWLLGACLAITGGDVDLVSTVAAFAVSRVLTMVVITPGGFGISETGTIALLVALGAAPGPAAAGIVLFALFTFVLEIPLGGLAWAVWTLNSRGWIGGRAARTRGRPGGAARRGPGRGGRADVRRPG